MKDEITIAQALNGRVRIHAARTTQLVSEMSYAEGIHRQVLYTVGLVLYIFIMIKTGKSVDFKILDY